MVDQFPDLVDIDKARSLPTSLTKIEDLKIWLKGGAKAREVTPLGYLGDPSAINPLAARESNEKMVDGIVRALVEVLRSS
jgi:creatinine amidohydrolase